MMWSDLDAPTRSAVLALVSRGFRSAAVRLIVSQVGCSVDDARAVIALREGGRLNVTNEPPVR